MEGKQDTFDVKYEKITNAQEYVPITDTLEDIQFTEVCKKLTVILAICYTNRREKQ